MKIPSLALCLASFAAVAAAGNAPPAQLAEEAYFVCAPSRSLQGGIFGKGPIRTYGPRQAACTASEWKRITRDEFKAAATEWYGVNWAKEIPFFEEARHSEAGK